MSAPQHGQGAAAGANYAGQPTTSPAAPAPAAAGAAPAGGAMSNQNLNQIVSQYYLRV